MTPLGTPALALASKASVWQAAYLGSIAAACQVSRLGNIPIRPEELLAEIGVPVVQWAGTGSLDQVLRDVTRLAAAPRVRIH